MTFLFHLPWTAASCLALLVVTAGLCDLSVRRIPNWLTVGGAAFGVAFNSLLFGASGLRLSLFGLGTAFVIYLVLYVLRAMGAGDVKLMAAVGAFLGPREWFEIFLLSSILGAMVGAIIALRRRRLGATLSNVTYILSELLHFRAPYKNRPELDLASEKAMTLPHGTVIAAATVLALVFAMHS